MSKSTHLEALVLDLIYRNVPAGFTRASNALFVALHTGNPGETGASAEASGSGYARVQRDAGNANWNRTGSTVGNAAEIAFPQLNDALGPITHWSIWTAASGGEMRHYGAFTTPRTFLSGDVPKINAGGITITES